MMTHMKIDWKACAAVETVPEKMSGQPVIRGTRVRPEDLLINRDQGVEWLARGHGIPADTIREVLGFYDAHKNVRAPAHTT
jgi:uncharacterized protein (DUF433 family)